jgi:uncharacterized protein YecE (DUF72 family)
MSRDPARWQSKRGDLPLEWEAAGRRVYVYFNNDGDGNAVRNAPTLKRLLL